MSATLHRLPRSKPRLVADRDRAIAREAFHRGLALGAALDAQRRRGLVAWYPPRVSEGYRALPRDIAPVPRGFAPHAYVVVFMAALAAFLVFGLRL